MISTQLRNQQRVKINTEVLKAFTNQSFSQKLLETSILKCFGAFSRQIVLQPSGVGQVFSNHGEQQADATNQTFFFLYTKHSRHFPMLFLFFRISTRKTIWDIFMACCRVKLIAKALSHECKRNNGLSENRKSIKILWLSELIQMGFAVELR